MNSEAWSFVLHCANTKSDFFVPDLNSPVGARKSSAPNSLKIGSLSVFPFLKESIYI